MFQTTQASSQSAAELLGASRAPSGFESTAATDKQRSDFRHIMTLLLIATTINHGLPTLKTHGKQIDAAIEDEYRGRITHRGVLNAVASILVMDSENIATTDLDISQEVLLALSDDKKKSSLFDIMVVKNSHQKAKMPKEVDCVLHIPEKPVDLGLKAGGTRWEEYLLETT